MKSLKKLVEEYMKSLKKLGKVRRVDEKFEKIRKNQ